MRDSRLQIRVLSLGLLAATAMVFVLLCVGCCGSITPVERTYTNVCQLRRVLNEFIAVNQRLPGNLEEFCRFDPRVDAYCRDGWGSPLTLTFEASQIGVIASPSKYHPPNGREREVSLIWTFEIKDSSGRWIGTNFGAWGWLSNPFMKELKQ